MGRWGLRCSFGGGRGVFGRVDGRNGWLGFGRFVVQIVRELAVSDWSNVL